MLCCTKMLLTIGGGRELMRTHRVVTWAAVGLVVLVLVVSAFVLGQSLEERRAPEAVVQSSNPTISELQDLNEWVALRVSVGDVLEMTGYEYKAAWLVHGDADIAVDFSAAKIQSKDEKNKKLVVLLPQPRAIRPRVDHDRTTTYDVKKNTWVAWVPGQGDPDKLRDKGMAKAQELVNAACTKKEVIEQARKNTQANLTNMYRFSGWQVEVAWRDSAKTSSAAE